MDFDKYRHPCNYYSNQDIKHQPRSTLQSHSQITTVLLFISFALLAYLLLWLSAEVVKKKVPLLDSGSISFFQALVAEKIDTQQHIYSNFSFKLSYIILWHQEIIATNIEIPPYNFLKTFPLCYLMWSLHQLSEALWLDSLISWRTQGDKVTCPEIHGKLQSKDPHQLWASKPALWHFIIK